MQPHDLALIFNLNPYRTLDRFCRHAKTIFKKIELLLYPKGRHSRVGRSELALLSMSSIDAFLASL